MRKRYLTTAAEPSPTPSVPGPVSQIYRRGTLSLPALLSTLCPGTTPPSPMTGSALHRMTSPASVGSLQKLGW